MAVDDQATTQDNQSISIHVLQNDDFGGSAANLATFTVLTTPSHGVVAIAGQNLLYEPEHGYRGTVSFSYSVCSIAGSCDQATVVVTIRN